MSSSKFIGKIRNYSIISFLLPLIAINGCLFVYKILGDMDRYSALNWNEKEYEYSFDNFHDIQKNFRARTFTNCSLVKVSAPLRVREAGSMLPKALMNSVITPGYQLREQRMQLMHKLLKKPQQQMLGENGIHASRLKNLTNTFWPCECSIFLTVKIKNHNSGFPILLVRTRQSIGI